MNKIQKIKIQIISDLIFEINTHTYIFYYNNSLLHIISAFMISYISYHHSEARQLQIDEMNNKIYN